MTGLLPLRGLRVYEDVHSPAAAHAGRLLRQMGAEVWIGTESTAALIPAHARGMFEQGKLVAQPDDISRGFDVVVSDRGVLPGPSSRRQHGDLPNSRILVEIQGADNSADPDGLVGGTSAGASAASGVAIAIGRPDKAPLCLPAGVPESVAGAQAVAAVLAQLISMPTRPVRIVLSLNGALEFFVGMNTKVFEGYPRVWFREGRRTAGSGGPYPAAIFPSKEGHIGIIGRSVENWKGILRAMGDPAWADDPKMRDPYYIGEHLADEIDSHLAAWTSQLTEAKLTELSLLHGFIVAPIRDLPEVFDEQQYRLRDFWQENPDGTLGAGLPFRVVRPEGKSEVPAARAPVGRPLEGIRVLDFTWVWAGPMASMILADLGAEVIKVEHPSRPDSTRLRGRPSHNGEPVAGPALEVAPYFHQLNHGKSSFGADLGDLGAQKILRKLAGQVDVVMENMRPGVLNRKGLGFDEVSKSNPGIVMLSMSLAGQTGPLSGMGGYAPAMSGLAGLESQLGYGPDDLTGLYTFSFADANAGIYGAIGVLAALLERRETGVGAYLDLSQVETTLAVMPLQLSAVQHGRTVGYGSEEDDRFAFQSSYCCAGESGWLAVTAVDDDAHDALRHLVSAVDAEATDDAVRRWATRQHRDQAEESLRAIGVNAVAALEWHEVVARRQARGPRITADIPHPFAAPTNTYVPPWLVNGAAIFDTRRAPFLGEHTHDLIRKYSLADDDEVTGLIESGALVQDDVEYQKIQR